MAELKTRATEVSVDGFLEGVASPERRADGQALCALMQRLTGEPPKMWGPSIIGFGSYHYRYDSGREGTMCRMGFSPRAKELVVYLSSIERHQALIARLGKVRTAKCCLYIKRLADVDPVILEQVLREDLAYMDQTHPGQAA